MASQADIQRIRDAIKNASSLAEVERLTRILQSGNIPHDLNLENSNGNGNGERAQGAIQSKPHFIHDLHTFIDILWAFRSFGAAGVSGDNSMDIS